MAEIGPVARQGEADAAVAGTLTVAGVSRPLRLTAKITEASADVITLQAVADFDRADFGMTWNQLGMIKGNATVSVIARFTRPASAR